ncbi:cytochrome P450 3A31-like [Dermacentor variabilis]|uniref:cytochrome P450 3A31-like n=1 Tax=Dermacentor variabilis TaxID=34621 RepID=UPI003F5B914A
MLLQAALILAVCGAFAWVIRRRHRHGLFERHGVPGPRPDLLWGNWKQLKKDRIQVMDQWIQHYGKVFGIYLGDKPFMVVTDVELIKECFIKATKVFQDRPMYALEVEPLKTGLLLLRASTNARFMDDHTLLCNLAMNTLAGFDTTSLSLGFLLYLLAKHPEEQQKVRAEIERRLRAHTNSEVECDRSNLEEKRELEQKRCQPRDNVPGFSPSHSSHNPKNASQNSEYGFSETKLAERTDLTKASSHQRGEKSELDEDDVMLLERLDMVVREGMRLYPAIPIAVMRECVEDTTILGRFIPAGTSIFAPPWHVHRNPEIWPEPNHFIPDRFSPARRDSVACCYFPFGLGPRMCVAHRLAIVTLKTALYRLIRDFEISLAGDIPDPLPSKSALSDTLS